MRRSITLVAFAAGLTLAVAPVAAAQQRAEQPRANFSFVDMPIRDVIAAFSSRGGVS